MAQRPLRLRTILEEAKAEAAGPPESIEPTNLAAREGVAGIKKPGKHSVFTE